MATNYPLSPATTTSSLASYDVVSACSEDDIIVWGLSDSENSQASCSAEVVADCESDDDFVLLQMPTAGSESAIRHASAFRNSSLANLQGNIEPLDCTTSCTPVASTSIVPHREATEELADSFAELSIALASRSLLGANATEGQSASGASDAAVPRHNVSAPSQSLSDHSATSSSSAILIVAGSLKGKPSKRKRRKAAKARKAQAPPSTSSGTVTPESDDSHTSTEDQTKLFEEASNYITAYVQESRILCPTLTSASPPLGT